MEWTCSPGENEPLAEGKVWAYTGPTERGFSDPLGCFLAVVAELTTSLETVKPK